MTDSRALIRRRTALAIGFSDDELAALIRRKDWVRLRWSGRTSSGPTGWTREFAAR